MKLYYIDDTMFENTKFNCSIFQRFQSIYEHTDTFMIAISRSHKNQILYDQFKEDVNQIGIHVIDGIKSFDIDNIRGVLSDSSLSLEGFPLMNSYSGSCVEFDLKTKTCQRIYLELFMNYDKFDCILRDIQKMMDKRPFIHKHKFSLH